MGMTAAIKRFQLLITALLVACFATEAFCRWVLHLPYPYNWPLMFPHVSFFDFTFFASRFQHFQRGAFFAVPEAGQFMYPAPVAVVYRFFYLFPHPTVVYLCTIVLAVLVADVIFARVLMRRGISAFHAYVFTVTSTLMAYPIWFEFKQANIELVTWLMVICGLWAFMRGRSWTASICFGLAGSMKYFPFVFTGVLIAKKQYRQAAFSFVVAIVATLLSLYMLSPSLSQSWHATQQALGYFHDHFMLAIRPNEIGFDHSAFALIKLIWKAAGHIFGQHRTTNVLQAYLLVSAVGGIGLFFGKIRHLPLVSQVMCLSIASILLPPVSFDYTLMHLFAPLALLVLASIDAKKAGIAIPGENLAFCCFAILMAPLSEFIFAGERFGGQIKAVTLIALMLIALRYPFQLHPSSLPAEPVA